MADYLLVNFRRSCICIMLAVLFLAPTALSHAKTYSPEFDLCAPVCCGCRGAFAEFGRIEVSDLSGGVLRFSVALFNGNPEFGNSTLINDGFPLTFGFNLLGTPDITYTMLTAGFDVPNAVNAVQSAGTYHMGRAGDFEYGVLWSVPGTGSGFGSVVNTLVNPLTFTISSPGLSLASLWDDSGPFYLFAIDIYSGFNGNSGLVAAFDPAMHLGTPGPVAGAGIPGLLLAFGSLVVWVRHRRRANYNSTCTPVRVESVHPG